MTEFPYSGSVAVVTGAGGGIGESIALSLARRGCRVVVSDIEPAACERVRDRIVGEGQLAIAHAADVSDSAAVQAVADRTIAEFGRVDILCNNAGVTMRPFRSVWDASLEDFKWMMEINYFGVVNGLHAFLPHMLGREGRRHVVNTSSMATLAKPVGHGMYTASKAAVDALSDVLRNEFLDQGEDIGVTVLYPGKIRTRIGTSERLRPVGDRSEGRDIREYPKRNLTGEMMAELDPEVVGPMVLRAIDLNEPYCLTHPGPVDGLASWLDNIRSGGPRT